MAIVSCIVYRADRLHIFAHSTICVAYLVVINTASNEIRQLKNILILKSHRKL